MQVKLECQNYWQYFWKLESLMIIPCHFLLCSCWWYASWHFIAFN